MASGSAKNARRGPPAANAFNMDPWIPWIKNNAVGLNKVRDLTPLIEQIKDVRIVMLGESSHGTHEFYEWRRLISEWLVTKHGFNFIAVEGDWPSCEVLDRYVRTGDGPDARSALLAFRRWPTWMWSNTDIVRLAEWMRSHNQARPSPMPVGFHGLDVYSLFESMELVVKNLEKINPFMARRARARYACFDSFWEDEWRYARSLLESAESCEEQVVDVLKELLAMRLTQDAETNEHTFDIRQNARVVANAEHYYRNLVHGREDSWNIRDRHMLETLEHLLERYTAKLGTPAKAIVWAHNTHIGDYRATEMLARGQINIGGLARERFGQDQVSLVGFGTYEGTVTASHAWDGPTESLVVPPAKPGSVEDTFHQSLLSLGHNQAWLSLDQDARQGPLADARGHRAIGVVYDPRHERFGNYVLSSLANRYDAFVFVDKTRALEPIIQSYVHGEFPETYPSGQ